MSLFHKNKVEHTSTIVVAEDENNIGSDSYARLRDNILYINATGKEKVIQVESALPHECKTTVSANLAVSLGLIEKKVLLVDLDLRRPRIHRFFNLAKEIGISDYILDNATKQDIIKKTSYKNVDIITRGQEIANPSLVFISDKFKNLMSLIKTEYDFIILDCAPILQFSDYIHISKVSDGILFLAAYGRTTKTQVADAVTELKKNNIKILGSVFTMYDNKKDKSFNYYGKNYSYEDDDKN